MRPSDAGFAELVESHWDAVYRFAYRLCGNQQDAEDVTQQTFYLALRGLGRFEGRSQVRTWLIRIAIRVATGVLRARERRPAALAGEPADPRPAEDPIEARERSDELTLALSSLRPMHRLVLTLFCVEGLSHREIAEALECPEGTVWSRLHYAKKQLLDRLSRKELS